MDSRIFSKQHGGGIALLRQSEIVYLQVNDKYINIYTDTNKYYVRSSLNECMRKLEKNFIRISRNVVVNFDNAVCVQDGEVIVNNGDKLSVSRRRWKEVKMAYMVYLSENRPLAT